jgi:hypothetical protein
MKVTNIFQTALKPCYLPESGQNIPEIGQNMQK